MAVLLTACKPAAVTTTTSTVPPPTTSTTVNESGATTTLQTTTTTLNPTSARDQLDEAKASLGRPDLVEGGKLGENGAFLESTEGATPFEDIFVGYYGLDENGNLVFYVEGPAALIRGLAIEFDAVDDNGAVLNEASYVGDKIESPPPWAVEAINGIVLSARDDPPPDTGPGDRLGVLIPTTINTLDEFTKVSIWLYSGLEAGVFDFAHYNLLLDHVLENSDPGVVAAAFFTGLLFEIEQQLAWLLITGGG